jgi:hypothetical protein
MSESREKAQLYLLIHGQYYLVEKIRFDGETPRPNAKGWRLTKFDDKLNHSPYCVIRQPSGRITCECGNFVFVGQREQKVCKHAMALEQIGLL